MSKGVRYFRWDRYENMAVDTHLSLVVSHRAPFGCRENTLLRRFSLITKNVLDQLWIRADALKEHEVSAEGFLRRIWVLHVCFPRLAGLALGGPVGVLPFDVFGSEGTHVRCELPFSCFFGSLRHALVFLTTMEPRSNSEKRRLDKGANLFLSGAEVCVLLTGLLGCLCDVELLGSVRLGSLDEVCEVELPCRRGQLRWSEEGLWRCLIGAGSVILK
jgi:hypothetical protein